MSDSDSDIEESDTEREQDTFEIVDEGIKEDYLNEKSDFMLNSINNKYHEELFFSIRNILLNIARKEDGYTSATKSKLFIESISRPQVIDSIISYLRSRNFTSEELKFGNVNWEIYSLAIILSMIDDNGFVEITRVLIDERKNSADGLNAVFVMNQKFRNMKGGGGIPKRTPDLLNSQRIVYLFKDFIDDLKNFKTIFQYVNLNKIQLDVGDVFKMATIYYDRYPFTPARIRQFKNLLSRFNISTEVMFEALKIHKKLKQTISRDLMNYIAKF